MSFLTELDIEINVILKSLIVVLTFFYIFPFDNSLDEEDFYLSKINTLIDGALVSVNQGCAGTIIDREKGYVLTSWHCIGVKYVYDEKTKEMKPFILDDISKERPYVTKTIWKDDHSIANLRYTTTVLASSRLYDLALLDISDNNFIAPIEAKVLNTDEKVIRGETVYSVGNPINRYGSLTKGIVSAFRLEWFPTHEHEYDRVSVIQYSGGTAPGSSGGALYNKHGNLIATISAVNIEANFIGLGVSYKVINKFLIDNCFGYLVNKDLKEECH